MSNVDLLKSQKISYLNYFQFEIIFQSELISLESLIAKWTTQTNLATKWKDEIHITLFQLISVIIRFLR